MSSGILKKGSKSKVAKRIRDMIGADDDEEVLVTTPTFNRPPGHLPPKDPSEVDQNLLDLLPTMSDGDLRALGLGRWAGPDDGGGGTEEWPGEFRLYLFPAEWYDVIPEGFLVVNILGNTEPFRRGVTDDDCRFGRLAYGILKNET